MSGTMRGVYTNLTEIRRRVFAEVAKIAYDAGGENAEEELDSIAHNLRNLPYEIIPGDVATYRESVFLERAIVQERIRLAMGLPLQDLDRPESVTEGLKKAAVPETYYEAPLVNVIKFACNACEDNVYRVMPNACQGCLAHPCREICPNGALTFKDKKAFIDHEKCIKCGRCARHARHRLRRARPRRDQLREVRLLRPVPRELPVWCHRRQEPDLPDDHGHQCWR